MIVDEVVQAGHLVGQVVLKLEPRDLEDLGGHVAVQVPHKVEHLVADDVDPMQPRLNLLLLGPHHEVLLGVNRN